MQKIIFLFCLALTIHAQAQIATRHLLGKVNQDSLRQEPYAEWFVKNYDNYHPLANTVTNLKSQKWKDIKFQIFFGSWCGDSKREVPRFLKLLDSIGVSKNTIELIGVDNKDSVTKKSPTGEEVGLGIFRVPTFIIYKNGKEINRINEYPTHSLEQDLQSIVTNTGYKPNYAAFATINNWLLDGSLVTDNTNAAGMANSIRHLVDNEYVLNSLFNLLIAHKKDKEALKLLKINYNLFSDKLLTQRALGEHFVKLNELEKAVPFLELALKNSKDKDFDEILKLLHKAKGLK